MIFRGFMFRKLLFLVPFTMLAGLTPVNADLLNDLNGDDVVTVTTFGDSITYGVGDGTNPGEFFEMAPFPPNPSGYPARLQNQLGIPVSNQGNPGELLTGFGVARFPSAIQNAPSDIVIIMEGANDATLQKSQTEYRRAMQQMINVAVALGKLPVLATLPPPCCNHAGSRPIVRALSDIVRNRANTNDLLLIDVERAWDSTCPSAECNLYNLPEGLHPNSRGYTAIAQTMMASLLDINIFAQDGPSNLEGALGLEEGSVIVKPDIPVE